MDGKELGQIRNDLAMLPALKSRLEKLNKRVYDAEGEVENLLSKLKAENHDVEKLKKDTLSVTLLKLIKQYDGRLDKEMQEAYAAKINYDKAVSLVSELKKSQEDILTRISKLQKDKVLYEKELEEREKMLMKRINDGAFIKYKELEEQRELMARELVETREAIRAANRAMDTAVEAMNHLKSAEGWATYDVWSDGGIFSHMAKYDHIDEAQVDFNVLESQLEELQKELSDVNLFDKLQINQISSTTRAVDFWFDNIFTDLNVRGKIRNDMDELDSLSSEIDSIIRKLEKKESEINKTLEDIENMKKELLISCS